MYKGVILDLDGTLYKGEAEVPGASRFVERVRERGVRCLYVTNRANRPPEDICGQLRTFGIPCEHKDVLTSAMATAQCLVPGPAYIIGEQGLERALCEAGFVITEDNPRYVIVSFDRGFSYDKLRTACWLIDQGARFIATNPDEKLKTHDGYHPGTGSIVAAVQTGCGATPMIVGKPEPLIFELAVKELALQKEDILVVGYNLTTDIVSGARAGLNTVLILGGVSTRDDSLKAEIRPTWVVEDFDALERIVLS